MAHAAPIVERVRKVILATFPAADIRDLELDPYYDRVTGVIIWPGFGRMTQRKRQQKLWDALESKLSRADANRLSLLITVSPTEYEAITADARCASDAEAVGAAAKCATAGHEGIVQRVRGVILATFPNADVHDLMVDEGGYDRVTGVIVSPDFEGMAPRKRQRVLWDALESKLAEPDLRRLSLLMTVSPTEYEQILAD